MHKTQNGSATVFGIMIVIVLALISTSLWLLVNSETRVSRISRDALAAEYAAEAGVKRAIVEFQKVNTGGTPDFSWLNTDRPFIDDTAVKKYTVTLTPVPASPLTAGDYVIQSTGTVGSVTKTVTVSVRVTGGGGNPNITGNVFNYSVYSKGDFKSWGGNPAPLINGDVGITGGSVNIQGYNRYIMGTVYTSTTPTSWFSNPPPAGWYVVKPVAQIGSFTVTIPSVPPLPSDAPGYKVLPTSTGHTYWNGTYNLAPNNYYNGDYNLSDARLVAPGGQAVQICINGSLTLTG